MIRSSILAAAVASVTALSTFSDPAWAGIDDIGSPDIQQSFDCTEVNGIFVEVGRFVNNAAFTSAVVARPVGGIAINFQANDVLTITRSSTNVAVFGQSKLSGELISSTELEDVSRILETGTMYFSVEIGGVLSVDSIASQITSDEGSSIVGLPMSSEGATFTCSRGGGDETVDQTAASGVAATRVKTTGLGFRADAGGGATGGSGTGTGTTTDVDLDQSGGSAFLSQSGGSGWTAWVALELRKFDGDYDGNAVNFAGGADYQISDSTALGVMLSFGQSDLDGGAGDFESKNRGVGPYFLHDFGNGLSAEGFLTYEAVDYDVAAGEFDADRISYGLTLKGSANLGGLDVTPFLRLEGFNEDQEAYAAVAQNDVTYRTLGAGARVDFDMGDFDPYISLAIENRKLTSESSSDENFNAPRLGFGFDYEPTATSRLSVDIDAGKVLEDTRDYGLILTYEADF